MSLRFSTSCLLSLISLEATHVLIWSRRRCRSNADRNRKRMHKERMKENWAGHLKSSMPTRPVPPSTGHAHTWPSAWVALVLVVTNKGKHTMSSETSQVYYKWNEKQFNLSIIHLIHLWPKSAVWYQQKILTCNFLISFLRSDSYFSFWFAFAALWSWKGEINHKHINYL